ncbi:hypothetical protein [Vulcanisaeta distributa]|uniref:hypothetical protein n=1 Tax=Vulcanisaeta distributa TaxID=164451 RepID=UPI000AB9AB8F|nr:hypothetical protein [Vulcanisaeta distributa]
MVAVAVLGQVNDVDKVVDGGLIGGGSIIIIGNTSAEVGGSEYLYAVHGIVRGIPPSQGRGMKLKTRGLSLD